MKKKLLATGFVMNGLAPTGQMCATKAIAFCVVFVLILSLVGCSKSRQLGGEKITLTVWEAYGAHEQFIQLAGTAYTKHHPNIIINFVPVDFNSIVALIAEEGPNRTGPDLFAAPNEKLSELVEGEHIVPIGKPDEIEKKALAACRKALQYDGIIYGYPIATETYALFYNKDLISERDVPKTWEDAAAFAKGFNEQNRGRYGLVLDVSNPYCAMMFIGAKGNRPFGQWGNDITSPNLTTQEAVSGMEFFQGTLRPAVNLPSIELAANFIDEMFVSGTAAMLVASQWSIKRFEEAGLNFGIAAMPSLPDESEPAPAYSRTRGIFISAYSTHKKEAADFAAFLMSREMQRIRFDLTNTLPVIKTADPYLKTFAIQLEHSAPIPSVPQVNTYLEALGNATHNIWDGADIQRQLDAAQSATLGM